MGQAAATQCVNVAIATALANSELRRAGVPVRNPIASNAVDPALFAMGGWDSRVTEEDGNMVVVVSTAQMVYNANATKLGTESIRSAAKKLAKMEIDRQALSERMASSNYMLTALCRSVAGGWEIDVRSLILEPHIHCLSTTRHVLTTFCALYFSQAVWAAFVLIVYLCCDPRGRPLLRDTGLTDLDVQTACAFEAYGRGEITRRARLRAAQHEDARKAADKQAKKHKKDGDPGSSDQMLPKSKGKSDENDSEHDSDFEDDDVFLEIDPDTGLPIEDDTASIVNDDGDESDDGIDMEAAGMVDQPVDLNTETSDQKVLATKRKRSNKGYATASAADSHGILQW